MQEAKKRRVTGSPCPSRKGARHVETDGFQAIADEGTSRAFLAQPDRSAGADASAWIIRLLPTRASLHARAGTEMASEAPQPGRPSTPQIPHRARSEERRVGKECRSRWS